MKTLLLVDGNSILNRAFYGIRPLTTSDGLFTQAVYGTVNILLKHLESLHPDYAAAAFDMRAPTFRHAMYDGYKANRHGMPEELAVQLPYAKRAVAGLGFKVIEKEGYEADDILGTAAEFSADDPELATFVLTGDRDSFQLIRDNVTVLLASTGDTPRFDRAAFTEKYGVKPEQFVDVKALMGDSSDNIPGVAGIGEKTALKLISDFGSLDGVYENLGSGKISASTAGKLERGRESAYMSQKLARIETHAPIGVTLSDMKYDGMDRAELSELFSRLELTALSKRLGLDGSDTKDAQKESAAYSETTVAELCALTGTVYADIADGEIRVAYSDGDRVAHRVARFDDFAELREFFSAGDDREICVYDCKKLYKRALGCGVEIKAKLFDAMLAAYVLDSSEGSYSPSRLAAVYASDATDDGSDMPELLMRICPEMKERLAKNGEDKLFRDIEMPLANVLAEMELRGFKVDTRGLEDFSQKLDSMCREYVDALYEEAGCTFNPNSPKQLADVLYTKLGLPAAKKTKTGYSTDAQTLEKLRPYSPVVDKLLEYRQVSKLKSTYADGLLKAADEDGRVHTIFNQTVTATGRLSSSEPNLQNIPIRYELGRELRKFFIPENDDYVLIDSDYSQIELRLLAAISGDANMIEAYREGIDIHALTASKVFGVPEDAVTPEMRKRAKAVNFGIVYGISDFSLAKDIGVTKKSAAEYIDGYFAQYPGVREYLDATVEFAHKNGYVDTLFGRRRYIPELASKKKTMQAFGERVAMNSPIQGAAADIIKIAMINVSHALKDAGIDARLILQVHDELIVESHRSCADEAARILKEEMENAAKLPVALEVDEGEGDTWYDC